MHRWAGFSLLLVFAACKCNEAAPRAEARRESAAAFAPPKSQVSLAPRCDKLISADDLKAICGVESLRVFNGEHVDYDCDRRFNAGTEERSGLRIFLVNEAEASSAQRRLEHDAADAKARKKYERVEGVGSAAHFDYRTFGKEELFRRMTLLSFVSGVTTGRIELAYHPQAKPLCEREKLPELARRIVQRLSAADVQASSTAPR